jgi:hypothetical protein
MLMQNVDIRHAAQMLKACGIPTGDQKLREYLVSIGAIRKTLFGYEVTQQFRGRGLMRTEVRRTTIKTHEGHQIPREYTVVIFTGDGCSWLREQLAATVH